MGEISGERHGHRGQGDSGFGLIEVMIAAGLMIIIAMGVSATITSGQRGARSIDKTQMYQDLVGTIRQVIDNGQLCKSSFAGQTLDNNAPAQVKLGPTVIDATSANQNYQGGAIKVLDMKFTDITNVGTNLWSASLRVRVDMRGSDADARVGAPTRDAEFKMVIGAGGAIPSPITSCGSGVKRIYTAMVSNPGLSSTTLLAACNGGDTAVSGAARPNAWQKVTGVPEGAAPNPPTGWRCYGEFGSSLDSCWAVCQSQ